MYESITDKELVFFHRKINCTLSIELEEVHDNPLFIVDSINESFYKIIPLFNCEEIISSNPEDRILENKCIICIPAENTIFSFISNTAIGDFSLITQIGSFNQKLYCCGRVFNKENLNPIKDVNLKVNFNNGTAETNFELKTDYKGEFILGDIGLNSLTNLVTTITAEYKGIIKTFINGEEI